MNEATPADPSASPSTAPMIERCLAELYLESAMQAHDGTVQLSAALPDELMGRVWLAIDAWSERCELLPVKARYQGSRLVVYPYVQLPHDAGRPVLVLGDSLVTPQLFGGVPTLPGMEPQDCSKAIRRAMYYSGRVAFPPGIYYVSEDLETDGTLGAHSSVLLTGARASVYSGDRRTVIMPLGDNVRDFLRVGDRAHLGPPLMVRIANLSFDGMGRVQCGVRILQGQNVVCDSVLVYRCHNGFMLDGAAAADGQRLLGVTLTRCLTHSCNTPEKTGCGYRIEKVAGHTGAFGVFALDACSSEWDDSGCIVNGGGQSPQVRIQSSALHGASQGAVVVRDACVTMADCYVEVAPDSPHSALRAFAGSRISLEQTHLATPIAPPVEIDATSVLIERSSRVCPIGAVQTPSRLGQLSDRLDWTTSPWGPPNHPAPRQRTFYPRGFAYTDGMGVEWVCVQEHEEGRLGNAVFIPRHGRILRPVTAAELVQDRILWFPHADMVVTRVSFLVTESFVPSSTMATFALGTLLDGARDDLMLMRIGPSPIPEAPQLLAGTVLTSATNPQPHARLAPAGEEMFLHGTRVGATPSPGNMVAFGGGMAGGPPPFTAGAGVLCVEGWHAIRFDEGAPNR